MLLVDYELYFELPITKGRYWRVWTLKYWATHVREGTTAAGEVNHTAEHQYEGGGAVQAHSFPHREC
jgi:hypothetical protein